MSDDATSDSNWLGGPELNRPRREPLSAEDRRGRHRCPMCRGEGRLPGITKVPGKGTGMGSDYGPCRECGGSGWTAAGDEALDSAPDDIPER
jgi:hypothetical protein